MICPKCGQEQEERVECLKCGIVFSKYFSLFPFSKTDRSEDLDDQDFVEQDHATSIAELRQQVRELGHRFAEIGFEKAERNQLRTDLKGLEQELNQHLESVAARFDEWEARASESQKDLIECTLSSLVTRLEQMESKLDTFQGNTGTQRDTVGDSERRIEELEERVSELPEILSRAHAEGQPDSEGVLQELDDVRSSVQDVSRRCSEIRELKSNHLALLGAFESLERDMNSARQETTTLSSSKIPEIEMEVLAIRSATRQAFEKLEIMEAAPIAQLGEIQKVREELDAVRSEIAALGNRFLSKLKHEEDRGLMDKRMNALEELLRSKQNDTEAESLKIAELQSQSSDFREGAEEIKKQIDVLRQDLNSLPDRSADKPCTAVEDDLHAIRENLDELRSFVRAWTEVNNPECCKP